MGADLDRRTFLATAAGLATTAVAGCSGDGDGGGPTPTDTAMDATATQTPTPSATSTTDTAMGSTPTGTAMGGTDGTPTETSAGATATATPSPTASAASSGDSATWRTIELTDVLTDETFTIAGLEAPVVIQSFAVWCPKCERQSKNLAKVDDSLTVVGLNTDPNEDARKVREHAESNGFGWRFAVSPTEMTDLLIDAFGSAVTVAPSTPLIIDCGAGDAAFRAGSILSADQVETVASDC